MSLKTVWYVQRSGTNYKANFQHLGIHNHDNAYKLQINVHVSISFVWTSSQCSLNITIILHSDDIQREISDESLNHDDFFGVSKLFTRKDLFKQRVHLGHKEGLLDQRMKKYLIGMRREQCIIDLDQTVPLLRSALNFTAHIAYRNGIILFVSRSPQFAYGVEQMARDCGEYAHTRHWQRGCFTNAQIQMGPGTRLPDLLVFFNTLNDVLSQHQAVVDAAKMNIPTVGVVDSNCNPNLITYPVPGNDDTPSAVELYMRLFRGAVLLGKQKRKEQTEPSSWPEWNENTWSWRITNYNDMKSCTNMPFKDSFSWSEHQTI